MKILDTNLFDTLSSEASETPRLRKHLNLHESYDEPSQRLLIAMEPGSYLRPHRHLIVSKSETFVCLRGKMLLALFSDDGKVIRSICMGPGEVALGAEVDFGEWHTVLSLERGTIFLETKSGPFTPISEGDMAEWAPMEGDTEVLEYQKRLRKTALKLISLIE